MKALNRGERVLVPVSFWRVGVDAQVFHTGTSAVHARVVSVQDAGFTARREGTASVWRLSRFDEDRTWCRAENHEAFRAALALS